MKAICQSSTCIMFLQGALKLNIPECVLNGIGIKSITETILKIAQDRKEGFDQLTSKQVDQILQWRSRRNRAKEKGEEYDNISLGAIDFDEKLSRNMESSTVVVLTNYLISNSNNSGDVFSGAEASEVGIGARSRGSSSSDKLKEQMWTDSSSLSSESTVARNSTPNWRLLVSLFVISLSWIYPFY
jgi:hypothetical protein